MDELFSVIIFVGILFLVASLPTTLRICRATENVFWYILFNLIFLFILSYCAVTYYFIASIVNTNVIYIVSCILLAGGGFVYLVTKLSYSSILKIEQTLEEQRFQAEHDSLTALPNRKMFFNSLSHYINRGIPCSVLFIDLNNFKYINDSFGHHIGDQLLIATAKMLQSQLIQPASLARIGGDEFAIILIQQNQYNDEACINKIKQAIAQPLKVGQQSILINLSIGGSHYPQDGENVDVLIKNADLAMYEAKKNKHLFVPYTQALGEKSNETLMLASKLKTAIEQEEFTLYYQPISSAKAGQSSGFEALIRWPQKDGSFIYPDSFIPIAEQTNLILLLTKWVVNQAARDLSRFKANGFTGTIHLNISAQDLQSPVFLKHIVDLHDANPTISDDITFEITESAMMTNIDAAREMILTLNKKGFYFSIDDFGTGFSSLSLLRELPIEQIKIDRSFVTNMLSHSADFAIVESIVFLANQLGCDVVAEGVENSEVEQLLLNLGCDYLQGYYYSKPITLEEALVGLNTN
ncbi:EAL domain-containing protein [Pseudoalteromonas sp. MMG010]|uniref:putative bifunctional diguanylate cyclase/phosphodiesterase n=1 Tax=Pseudoalteromonas sp. MMG010 TaxID=2822685 RepID=UPI001B3A0D02|nr:EAL domain-containing protein [Pseudoalteromonas sp. MMG010]MBQ4834518.1 EAL domain-containing protein [Pseudoalteromonas sp. MMG010]